MATFTQIIPHSELGGIQIYWNEQGQFLACTVGGASHHDLEAVESRLEGRLAPVYDFLASFGKRDEVCKLSFDIFDFSGYSPFTVQVYKTLFAVPKATLITYGELAEKAGFARAARAVGTAMRKNRFLMLIPCHRVVASSSLGGFAVGLETKIKLLQLEQTDLSSIKDERLRWL
ncbi:MAG: MGMT family protein [Deferribacteraceae bacterium]|nr:MGMT family protein [Deferribacteraceae bacterium]